MLLCTGNTGKMTELKALLPASFEFVMLSDVGLPLDLPETGNTLEANALQKARYAFERTGMTCIADDTGLEVDALDGAPGVFSARYAGEAKDPASNMAKLLDHLKGRIDRTARFRTVLALVSKDGEETFHGVVEGVITNVPKGNGGFGYDPIFMPVGSTITFAEMAPDTKNGMSHRGRAMRKLMMFLEEGMTNN